MVNGRQLPLKHFVGGASIEASNQSTVVYVGCMYKRKFPPRLWYAGLMLHGFGLVHESVHETFSATILHGSLWSTLVNGNPLFEECSIECIRLVFTASIGHPTFDLRVILDANQFKEVLCRRYHCSFGAEGHCPGM